MYHNMIQVCHFSFRDFCINSTNYISLYCQISREMSSVLFTDRQTDRDSNILQQIYAILSAT